MDNADSCTEIRPLLAELAIGAAGGHERAAAMRHLASCPACSRELRELADVADGLLLLAPQAEPPAGFESAVVARMTSAAAGRGGGKHQGRWRRRRVALAAGIVAVALTGGAAGAAWTRSQDADDRALADKYRHVLSVADGQYLRAMRLNSESGSAAGTVFVYRGRPSWVLVSVTSAPEDGPYSMVVTDSGGKDHSVGVCDVASGAGTYGYQLPSQIVDLTMITLHGPDGIRLRARAS